MGDSGLYARARDGQGRYWNWGSLGWSVSETEACQSFLSERLDVDVLESNYGVVVSPPLSSVVIEFVRSSDGEVVGEEVVGKRTFYSLRYTKGLGSAALSVRVLGATGLFWNFTTNSWVVNQNANTYTLLSEYPDLSSVESLYASIAAVPVDSSEFQFFRVADGFVIGTDTLMDFVPPAPILGEAEPLP
jgi:hypothetical protein